MGLYSHSHELSSIADEDDEAAYINGQVSAEFEVSLQNHVG